MVVIIVDFGAAWCTACKELDKITFAREDVRQEAGRFLAVKVDATNDEDPEVTATMSAYKVVGLPTVTATGEPSPTPTASPTSTPTEQPTSVPEATATPTEVPPTPTPAPTEPPTPPPPPKPTQPAPQIPPPTGARS